MSTTGSYRSDGHHRSLDTEVNRLRAQALLSWEKEARTLAWFGLRDGMAVLELGSGPGFITEQLLAMLPGSSITALEVDPVLIKKAREYLGGRAGDQPSFVEASVMDTGLPDDTFDFAIARLLFQHLPDPVGAATEVLRVLKPGGRLAITDIDDAIWGLSAPEIAELDVMFQQYAEAQAARGGDRFVGRKMWRILKEAGFENLDLEAVLIHSDSLGIEAFLPQFDPDRLVFLVQAGRMSEKALEDIRAAREAFLASGNPYILMVILMACGEKPG